LPDTTTQHCKEQHKNNSPTTTQHQQSPYSVRLVKTTKNKKKKAKRTKSAYPWNTNNPYRIKIAPNQYNTMELNETTALDRLIDTTQFQKKNDKQNNVQHQ